MENTCFDLLKDKFKLVSLYLGRYSHDKKAIYIATSVYGTLDAQTNLQLMDTVNIQTRKIYWKTREIIVLNVQVKLVTI